MNNDTVPEIDFDQEALKNGLVGNFAGYAPFVPPPKFSIIVGVYNQSQYIFRLVKALHQQTFTDFEVIFCDDGSTDDPESAIREAYARTEASFPFKYVRQANRGMRLAKSLNNGIRMAQGQYCVFIMADSYPDTNYLELINSFISPEKVLCGVRVHIEEDYANKKPRIVEVDYRIRKGVIPKDTVLLSTDPWEYITGNGLTIPTEALRQHGGWNEKIKGYGGDDTELVAWLYFKGYLVYSVPALILYHNYHINKETAAGNLDIVTKLINQYAGF